MDDHDPLMEAVDALRAAGHAIAPMGDDLALWQIDGDKVLTDSELLALAIRTGLIDGSDAVQ